MNPTFHLTNRQRLAAHLAEGDVMLFFCGEGVQKSADEHYPFFANRNFLYLTGVRQEGSALLLHKQDSVVHERLFALKPDQAAEVWTGRRLTDDELRALSGVEQIEDLQRLSGALDQLLSAQPTAGLWLCFDQQAPKQPLDLERRFARQVRRRHPQALIKNSSPLVCAQRKIKAPEEIEAIRQAIEITGEGIQQMARLLRPGRTEIELEAAFNANLAAHGQRRTAFPSIISSGERNFYLHYTSLHGQAAAGELALFDVGAVYDEYCSDIARVFPVDGRFSQRQAQIYQIAYEANRAIMAQVRPGASFRMTNQVCREVTFAGLKALGLLDDLDEIGRYVWHGVAHHVGLDTHDVGGYADPMAENMVFTVDAGIYVREWGIGLRIEDNLLVTAGGCENLSAAIPATIEAVQACMAG